MKSFKMSQTLIHSFYSCESVCLECIHLKLVRCSRIMGDDVSGTVPNTGGTSFSFNRQYQIQLWIARIQISSPFFSPPLIVKDAVFTRKLLVHSKASGFSIPFQFTENLSETFIYGSADLISFRNLFFYWNIFFK